MAAGGSCGDTPPGPGRAPGRRGEVTRGGVEVLPALLRLRGNSYATDLALTQPHTPSRQISASLVGARLELSHPRLEVASALVSKPVQMLCSGAAYFCWP